MKSILLFYKLLFFKPLYVIATFFLFFIFILSTSLQLVFPKNILLLRIFVFGSIFLLVFITVLRYIWFILKYKKEVLNLSNKEFEKKYPQLSRIEKNEPTFTPTLLNYGLWLRSKLPLIASKFGEESVDQQKRNFLYKIHLRFYIVELFLVSIFIPSFSLFYYFMLTMFSIFSFETQGNSLSIIPDPKYSGITASLFFSFGLFAIIWINQTRSQLILISENLLTNSVEKCKKSYKSTLLRFYIP
ncbi:hypothetical protein [Mesomycoplasma dispar]|uniref:Uncharacterized protein n=1 Tax=Mesomycoplasma dispar TaxID=86660 RepID=A0ABN5DZV0_9BACT|nr:hypothetical protein [Mesomycoplasma dispar]ATP59478.1 hypothetical protein CSW10_00685 [Mesomycoplasma dispar]